MNCHAFEKIILTLSHDQLIDAATREQGLAHKELCARCAMRLAEEQALLVGVRAVVAEISEVEAPAPLQDALLTAFRKQATATPSAPVTPLPVRNRTWQHWTLTAIAAGILILFSIAIIFWQQSNALTRQPEKTAKSPASEPPSPPPASPGVTGGQVDTGDRADSRPQRRLRHRAPTRRLPQAEEVTAFIPLMEGDDLSSLESGQIVRVELPRLALLDIGLPVDAAMVNESVKADLLLRDDGLARAIRFVR